MRTRVALALGLLVALLVAYLASTTNRQSLLVTAPSAGTSDSTDDDPVHRAHRGAGADAPSDPTTERRRVDAVRARLVALIAEAGVTPAGAAVDAHTPAPPATGTATARGAHGEPLAPMPVAGGPTDKEGLDAQARYIRARLQNDLWVLVRQCYAAERQRDPAAQGTVYLVFRILGDPSVGGVVDDVTVDAARSDIKDAAFADCVDNSMMTVAFAPPSSQMDIPVEYPMVLSPSDAYPEAGW